MFAKLLRVVCWLPNLPSWLKETFRGPTPEEIERWEKRRRYYFTVYELKPLDERKDTP